MDSNMDFRELIQKLADGLCHEHVLMINYLCKDCIRFNLNQPVSALQILTKFEERGFITMSDMSFLAEVLYRVQRIDLLKLLPGVKSKKDYETNYLKHKNFSAFRIACFRLINLITQDDFNCLKNLCKDRICNRNFHKSSCIVSLLVYLEEEDVLSEGSLEFFMECLSRLDNTAPYEMFCHLMQGEEHHILFPRDHDFSNFSHHSISHSQSLVTTHSSHCEKFRSYSSVNDISNQAMPTNPKMFYRTRDSHLPIGEAQAQKFFLGPPPPPTSNVDNRTFSEEHILQKPNGFHNGNHHLSMQYQPNQAVPEYSSLPNISTGENSFANLRFPEIARDQRAAYQPELQNSNQSANELQALMHQLNVESHFNPEMVNVPVLKENFQSQPSIPNMPQQPWHAYSNMRFHSPTGNQFLNPMPSSYRQPHNNDISSPQPLLSGFLTAKNSQFQEYRTRPPRLQPTPHQAQHFIIKPNLANSTQNLELPRPTSSTINQRHVAFIPQRFPHTGMWPNGDLINEGQNQSQELRYDPNAHCVTSPSQTGSAYSKLGVGTTSKINHIPCSSSYQRQPFHNVVLQSSETFVPSIDLSQDVVDGQQSSLAKFSKGSNDKKTSNTVCRKDNTVPCSSIVYTSTGSDSSLVTVMSSVGITKPTSTHRRTFALTSIPNTGSAKPICFNQADSLDCYPMDSSVAGICLIINNCCFELSRNANKDCEHFKDRKGSEVDVEAISDVFKLLRFDVKLHKDLDAKTINVVLEETAKSISHENYSCFILVIMSHGGLDPCSVIYGVDGKRVKTVDIKKYFQPHSCPSLKGKPKVFFYQACQTQCQTFVTPLKNSDDLDQDGPNDNVARNLDRNCPEDADFLICYATVPGGQAYRSKKTGSFFIKHTAENIKKHYQTQDLLSIMTQVNRELVDRLAAENLNQVAMPVHTLRGKIYFKSQ